MYLYCLLDPLGEFHTARLCSLVCVIGSVFVLYCSPSRFINYVWSRSYLVPGCPVARRGGGGAARWVCCIYGIVAVSRGCICCVCVFNESRVSFYWLTFLRGDLKTWC